MRRTMRSYTALLTLGAATIGAFTSSLWAQQPPTSVTSVVLHADQPGPRIDRHVFGQFAEHLGRGMYEGLWVGKQSDIPNTRGFRNDVVAALRELRVPVVRWPGGCFADEYHWRDGIGPQARRPVTVNTSWGGVAETNAVGTHEFLDFAEQIGADAYINANLGTGTPQEMSDWLLYMTSDQPTSLTTERARNGHPKPWHIAYFGLGNELWGCGGNMTPRYYVDLFRRYATHLKAPGTPPAIVAAGGHDEDTSWTEELVGKAADQAALITFHYYTIAGDEWRNKGPATGFGEDQWIATLAHTLRMDDFIAANTAVMDRYDPTRKVGFAIDEWGTWYDPEPGRAPNFLYQQNTLRDALAAALNLNIFQRHADRVRMANIAQMVNVLQAMILTRGPRMVLTPTYHVFRLYRTFQDAAALPIEMQAPHYTLGAVSVPQISAAAARTAGGDLVLSLVNLHPRDDARLSIDIRGFSARSVRGELLTATATDAHNTFDNPDAVRPVAYHGASLSEHSLALTLPPKCVVILYLQ